MKTSGYIIWALVAVIAYPAFSHAGFLTPDIRVNTGGEAGTTASDGPSISSLTDGHVFIAWSENRDGYNDIYFNYSADYGSNWQNIDTRVDLRDAPGSYTSGSVKLCSLSDGHIYAVWQDQRNSSSPTGNFDILFNYSTDYGVSWRSSSIRLDTDTPGAATSLDPHIGCHDSGHIYVSWKDSRNGSEDIYFNVSSDYGVTWLANDIRLDRGDTPGASTSTFHEMCSTGNGEVYVVWQDTRNGSDDIYLNYSYDYGITWQNPDIRIDTGDAPGENISRFPAISCENDGYVYSVWSDQRSVGEDVLINISSDYGQNWLPNPIRVDLGSNDSNESVYPEIASTSDGHVYSVWEDGRYGIEPAVLFNRSLDHGATWESDSIPLNLSPGTYYTNYPKIVATDIGGIYVVWGDAIRNPGDIYFDRSLDYGETWLTSPVYADTGDSVGYGSLNQVISVNSSRAYLAWKDRRNGFDYPDIYSNTWSEDSAGIPTVGEFGLITIAILLLIILIIFRQKKFHQEGI